MKSFKIVALQVLSGSDNINIPLTDGLIINKENKDGSWIIEAYVEKQYSELFEKSRDKEENLNVQVIITHPDNDPAPFTTTVHTVKKIGEYASILLEGKLSRRRGDYAEDLLAELLKEGLEGEDLFVEFKNRIHGAGRKA